MVDKVKNINPDLIQFLPNFFSYTTSEELFELVKTGKGQEFLTVAAEDELATTEIIDYIYNNKFPLYSLVSVIAENPKTSPETLEKIFTTTGNHVSLASNPATPTHILTQIFNAHIPVSDVMAGQFLHNPNLPQNLYDEIWVRLVRNSGNVLLLQAAITNPLATSAHLKAVCSDFVLHSRIFLRIDEQELLTVALNHPLFPMQYFAGLYFNNKPKVRNFIRSQIPNSKIREGFKFLLEEFYELDWQGTPVSWFETLYEATYQSVNS